MTTATTTRMVGMPGWMRTALLTACLTLLVAAAPPRGVEATQFGDIRGAASTQEIVCAALGGEIVTKITRIFNGAVISIQVICQGGLLDGMDCTNYPIGGTKCSLPRTRVDDGPVVRPTGGIDAGFQTEPNIDGILSSLEGGLTAQQIVPGAELVTPKVENIVITDDQTSTVEAPTDHSPGAVGLDDNSPDNRKVKAKVKGKKGKKGGKGRKR